MMTEEVRREIDGLRSEIRQIGATLRQLREDLAEIDRIKTGPKGEIDLESWNRAEEVREKIRVCQQRRDKVQWRLNSLLRPFRAARVVPALRETAGTVKDLLGEVRKLLPPDSLATPHLQGVLDEALTVDDDGDALGRILDLFMFRRFVEQSSRCSGSK